MLKFIFAMGEKGGIGKSTAILIVLDYLIRTMQTCLLVDTETSQTPTSTIVGKKCGLLEQGKLIRVNAANESALMDLPRIAERLPEGGTVLVDTGAGSQRLLLPVLPGILASIAAMGAQARIAYLLTAGAESIQAVRRYLDAVRSCGDSAEALQTIFLFADRTEESPDAYKIMQSVGIRERYPEFATTPRHWVGKLPQVISDCISKASLLPSTAVDGTGLDIVRRTLLANMRPQLDRLAQVILGEAEPEMPATDEDFLE